MLNKFIAWCQKNNILLKRNEDLFFINERLVIKPDFKVGKNTFIDLIRPDEINAQYLEGCKQFGRSYGTLVVIPVDTIKDLDAITKADIENKFQILL